MSCQRKKNTDGTINTVLALIASNNTIIISSNLSHQCLNAADNIKQKSSYDCNVFKLSRTEQQTCSISQIIQRTKVMCMIQKRVNVCEFANPLLCVNVMFIACFCRL